MTKKITKDTFPQYKPHSLVADMPEHLKDYRNYNKIQKALLETLASSHSHSEVEDWAKCVKCQEKVTNHKLMMKKLGFTGPAQYKAWQKIHQTIQDSDKTKMDKYNT